MDCEKLKKTIFDEKPLIGMLHLPALPGTPKNLLKVDELVKHVLTEAEILVRNGLRFLMIENMHDVPYLNKNVGPEITTSMAIIADRLKTNFDIICGVQVLAAANKDALAIAHSAGLDFIRSEGFVFSHVADEGIIESDAGELLRYRKFIGAEDVAIFTDVKKKHSSHKITEDVSLVETIKAAEYFLSDGIIVTGDSTGHSVSTNGLDEVYKSRKTPLFIGSGITAENLAEYYNFADAFIVGSYLKKDGYWANELDENRIKKIVEEKERLAIL